MTRFTGMTDTLSGARRRDAEEFADLLESGRTRLGNDLAPLVGLARALTPAEHLPEPAFRTSLRAQLVAEAAVRVPALPAQRVPERARPSAPRWRHAVAAVAVASAVSGVGSVAASSQALPGETLYGLKLRVEAIQLSLADSYFERGRELLEQAETRLGEAERLAVASSTSSMSAATRDELTATLTTMDAAAAAGAAALVESYEETGDPESMVLLARFVDRQQLRLQDLSVSLDGKLRVRVQRAIDALAVVAYATNAVLSPTAGPGEAAGETGRPRADSWATSRGALPPSSATGSAGTNTRDTNGTTAASESGAGDLAAATTRSGAAAADSGLPPVSVTSAPAVTAQTGPLPEQSVPLPSVVPVSSVPVSSVPATSVPVTPLPTVTSAVPLPTAVSAPSASAAPPVTTCVAVPPLTTC